MAPILSRSLNLPAFHRMVSDSRRRFAAGDVSWFESCLATLQVTWDLTSPLPELPAGPVVVTANHPYGLVDALVLGAMFAKQNRPVRFLANHLLAGFPELEPWIIPVDPFGRTDSARRNTGPLREALRLLADGGILLTFPAGEVAAWRVSRMKVTEKPWHTNLGGLIQRTGATVVPVHFHGTNSALFHALGVIHPMLRTGMLPREMLRMTGSRVRVTPGAPVPARRIRSFTDPEKLMSCLRMHTLLLGKNALPPPPAAERTVTPRAVCSAWNARLAHEADALCGTPAELVRAGDISCFCAEAPAIPYLLREIGRLREETFRAVGEGTGQDLDLDPFDDHYLHIFLWDHAQKKVMGGYRAGLTDQILKKHGPRGLYTSTLFQFKPALLQRLTPALELGRSFIRAEYQGHRHALPLLWRGIGEFIVRSPRYRLLFGPVSISRDYTDLSRSIMFRYLQEEKMDEGLSRLVRPRSPFRDNLRGVPGEDFSEIALRDVDALNDMVSSLEQDGKGIPILLKHYLKLNARLLSFNVDASFSDVVDGLILVDMLETDQAHQRRYLGPEGAEAFVEWHRGSRMAVPG